MTREPRERIIAASVKAANFPQEAHILAAAREALTLLLEQKQTCHDVDGPLDVVSATRIRDLVAALTPQETPDDRIDSRDRDSAVVQQGSGSAKALDPLDALLRETDVETLIKDYADTMEMARGWYHNVEQWGEESWIDGKSVDDLINEKFYRLASALRNTRAQLAQARIDAHELAVIRGYVGERGVTDASTPLFVRVQNIIGRAESAERTVEEYKRRLADTLREYTLLSEQAERTLAEVTEERDGLEREFGFNARVFLEQFRADKSQDSGREMPNAHRAETLAERERRAFEAGWQADRWEHYSWEPAFAAYLASRQP